MIAICDYVDRQAAESFRRAVPQLRKRVGVREWPTEDDTYGVRGNTFRGFQGWESRPSDVYRSWAQRRTKSLGEPDLLRAIQSKSGFERWHAGLVRSIQRHWAKYQGRQLGVAHKYKLVDLYVKWLSVHAIGTKRLMDALVANAHCALDRQTLSKLNICLSGALPMGRPSMGYIQSEATYQFCQDVISQFAGHCGGTPLLFDYYAWKRGG